MYVCVYVCMYVCVYVCMYVCMYCCIVLYVLYVRVYVLRNGDRMVVGGSGQPCGEGARRRMRTRIHGLFVPPATGDISVKYAWRHERTMSTTWGGEGGRTERGARWPW